MGCRLLVRWLVGLSVVLLGCEAGGPSSQAGGSTGPDTAPIVFIQDTQDGSAGAFDSSSADLGDDVTASDSPKGLDCPAKPGCTCQEPADCDSGHCLATADGKQCAQTCVDKCPEGFACVGVQAGGGDLQNVCVSRWQSLCNPCSQDADCDVVGLPGSACVGHGNSGAFCGTPCSQDGDCPSGYGCQGATTTAGKSVQQCVRLEGECACSTAASAAQLSTTCSAEAKDESGQLVGSCQGLRTCGPDGLSACTAQPMVEACNGADDDCDGLTDETICDDGNACSVDLCEAASGTCSHQNSPGSCDADGNSCTEGDTCQDGACKPGGVKSCDDGNPCTFDACLPAKGCTATSDDGAPCSDGSDCTASDKCQGGACQGTPSVQCDDGNPCTSDSCDPKLGCVSAANQAPCDDGNGCTVGDTCLDKACASGTNTCQCQSDTDCAAAEDGNPCNGTLFCDKSGASFQCKVNPATVVTCQTGGDGPCLVTACVPATGKCAAQPAPAGKPCDADASACTVGDACQDGGCMPGKALDCDDGNGCTADSCDPKTGCSHTASGAACDADGNACTVGDACKDKACVAGPLKSCDDGQACTLDTCNAKTGACASDGQAQVGQACDADGTLCTGPDKCACGSQGCGCVAGPALSCDDGNACTTDACAPKVGCSHSAVADQSGCGVTGWCLSGTCVAKPSCGNGKVDQASEQCDDGNQVGGDGCSASCQKEGAKPPQPGQIVITEILPDPTTEEATHEWFEIHNPTSIDLLLTGLTIKDNNGSDVLTTPGLVLPAGGWMLIASAANVQGVQAGYSYSSASTKIALANTADEVTLLHSGQVIDQVLYGSGKPGWKGPKSGAAYQLSASKLSAQGNDDGTAWCFATKVYGTGPDLGTPGLVNAVCP